MPVVVLMGTRPEAIKLIPIVNRLRADGDLDVSVWSSGQHQAVVNRTLGLFGLQCDVDLGVFRQGQEPSDTVGRILIGLKTLLEREKPDFLLVAGDTSTSIAGALAGFYAGVGVVHLEAGLRSGDCRAPFPEEMNRRLITRLADLHLAQDETSRANLVSEGVLDDRVQVVGNPGIDLLVEELMNRRSYVPCLAGLPPDHRLILVTLHRRENMGEPLRRICGAIRALAAATRGHADILLAVHPRPALDAEIRAQLGGVDNIILFDPVDYPAFVHMLLRASMVLTDSGGVQEEAVFLGKPLLVLRETSERSLGPCGGSAVLVDSKAEVISSAALDFLTSGDLHRLDLDRRLAAYRPVSPLVASILRSFAEEHAIRRPRREPALAV